MNLHAINHIPKSHMAYAFNKDTLHIILQTAKNDVDSVTLLIGDPFDWDFVDGKYVWVGASNSNHNMYKRFSTDLFDYYFIEYQTTTLRSKYAFLIRSGNQDYFYGCRDLIKLDDENKKNLTKNLFGYFNFPYINEGDLNDSPAWAKDMIWYQIFPDRFARENHDDDAKLLEQYYSSKDLNEYYFGGTIKGIINKIPYLKEIGITGLYFTPIFKAYSPHKYDTENYFEIDPSFGTKKDLKNLVDECHKNDIKIMLDAVFNHCGWEHPFWQDVIEHKTESKYYNWFFIDDKNFINFEVDKNNRPVYKHMNIRPNYKTFAFTPVMPKWNADNKDTREYLISVARYWTKEFDIDGWRLDVSNEVSHSFWREFKKEIRKIKSDIYILGENWDDSTAWLRGDQYDAVMNYEFAYPVWQFFTKDKSLLNITSNEFRYRIDKLLLSYPDNITQNMFNMIGSHDTSRIGAKCLENKDLIKLCLLFMFNFSGSPAIYYGDELGMGKTTDRDHRSPMKWGEKQDKKMLHFFKKMVYLRNNYKAFSAIDFKWLYSENNVLIYQKEDLIFIINNNDKDVKIVALEELKNHKFLDLYQDQIISINDQINISKYGFYILKIKK